MWKKSRLVLDVVPRTKRARCGGYGQRVRKNKDRARRYWQQLDLFGVRTYFRYSIRRVVCRQCGVVKEQVPWASKGSRFTDSFEQEVAWLAQRMDMWEAFMTVVGRKAPQARIIFDRFHIVSHLNEAVDETRRELLRPLKGKPRRDLKNTKFPLLKAKHNRTAKDRRILREQVKANRTLYRAMLLRDDFMDLYTYKSETWAAKFLRNWINTAIRSG